MFVADHMTTSPITITKETPVLDALELMKKHRFRELPVVQGNRLVSLVTEKELLAVSPSPATTLSVYEIRGLMSKLMVSDVMIKNPITVDPYCTIEEAALIMREHKISCLLVEENEVLVGIITQTDIFEALIKILGLRKAGTRMVIESRDRVGLIAEITSIVRDCKVNVIGIAVLEKNRERVHVMLRLGTKDPGHLIKALEEAGFKIVKCSC
ncbi:acetoin utilization protein AcuB [Desulfohalotomaculum tongense]|uniref:CBS and ACT domain-containing protein n=1 Tax=Desulforadius tongensis TaxID=1216062 RepID=UPI00195A0299|nr:CBS and ACT domain-containing protein [Desulforadius tongensis]MBM7855383.1 acetoin utilization protein AcuB [Desulforadius tongensis]